ncbi:TonB-dependent receptor domain-containing protein [Sphingomonas sp. Mn802worker]|uniref:TonB-dependent receptor domain-containing protein n=1 Tax=Sphingomonas sp. Mn802worker TaxID=629773 RepID=UPI001EE7419F|nr:TonB-dependent receptor [Sphingomonas sp. Mn802worker]
MSTPASAGAQEAPPSQNAPLAEEPAALQSPQAAPPADQNNTASDIVVTGSRLGRTGYSAPTPVNVIGDARLKNLAIPNVADALNQIPSFRPIASPAANSFRVSGNIGARTLDLRGLGPTRTLTLVDGRRFVASSDNGTVDLNSIPSILVQRTEVVTGGASAAYGANAVAGVVNLILDDKLQGIKAEANAGVSQRGDGRNYYLAAAGGTDFADGRGHIILGGEWSKEGGVGTCETRAWCNKYTNYIANPGYNTATRTSTNGLPANLVLDNVMFVQNENGILSGAIKPNGAGGTITLGQQVLNVGATALPAALRGKQFDEAGNLIPYTFGNYLSGLFQQLRDPTQPYLLGFSPTPLVVPTEHFSAMARVNYDVSDAITFTGEFMYSRVIGGPTATTPVQDSPATIDINNPYLSAATRATVLAADPTITKLLVNSSSFAIGPVALATSRLNSYRGALGLKGSFSGGWDWDVYYTYGRVTSDVRDEKSRLKEWNDGIDAVRVTAANVGTSGLALGSIVCRTTLSAPTNGCIPINLFGYGQVSQAAIDRYLVTETQTRTYEQQAAAVNLRGSPFSTWAGDVKVAVGGEWRRDTAQGSADANTLAGNYIQAGTTALPFTKTSVVEGYLEAGVPLLRDSRLGKALDIDGAARFTHYDPFGDATTWKGGVVYKPVQDLTFRVTRSRDIRAPTAQEASPNATTVTIPLADPFIGQTTLQTIVTGGNPNLRLERGDTFTAGIVLQPSFVPRFNLSLDYYDIKVKGAIDSLSGPVIASACKQQQQLCNLITFNPNGSINTVLSNFQNLSQLHAEGLELVADYRIPTRVGAVDVQLNGNYVIDLSTLGATGLRTQIDDVTGNFGSITNIQGVPRWRADAVVTYSEPSWALTLHGRYIPRAKLDSTKIGPEDDGYDVNLPNSISTNRVDGRFYLDATGRIKIPTSDGKDRFELFIAVNNIFDKGEPDQLRIFGNALYFDPVGRNFRVGARTRF